MILGVLNIDNTLKEELSKDFTIDTILDTKVKAEALFVDWIPSQVSKSLDKTKQIDLSNQSKGVYIIKIKYDSGVKTKRLLIH